MISDHDAKLGMAYTELPPFGHLVSSIKELASKNSCLDKAPEKLNQKASLDKVLKLNPVKKGSGGLLNDIYMLLDTSLKWTTLLTPV
jgi:hypothetical protein